MKKKILILGDPSLVDEYASLCSEKGVAVASRLNGKRSITLPKNALFALELTNVDIESKKKNIVQLDKSLAAKAIIISSSTTVTVTEQATWLKHPGRLIGIGALPTLIAGTLMEFAASSHTNIAAKKAVEEFAKSLNRDFAFVADSPGLVMPRILCALANEACFAMMEGVAEGNDIDTAMKLGTNYPRGPVEWAERIGYAQVLAVMNALHKYFGEDRYRAAPLLQQKALQGSRAH
jgi:3-hydroxybutyryl-CoA dehydrogenase